MGHPTHIRLFSVPEGTPLTVALVDAQGMLARGHATVLPPDGAAESADPEAVVRFGRGEQVAPAPESAPDVPPST